MGFLDNISNSVDGLLNSKATRGGTGASSSYKTKYIQKIERAQRKSPQTKPGFGGIFSKKEDGSPGGFEAKYTYSIPQARVLIGKKQWYSLKKEFSELGSSYLEKGRPIAMNVTKGLVARSDIKNAKVTKTKVKHHYDSLTSEGDLHSESFYITQTIGSTTGAIDNNTRVESLENDITELEEKIGKEKDKKKISNLQFKLNSKVNELRKIYNDISKDDSVSQYVRKVLEQAIARLTNIALPSDGYDYGYEEQRTTRAKGNGLGIRFLSSSSDFKASDPESNLLEVEGFSSITVNNQIEGNSSSAQLNIPLPENIAFVFDGDAYNNTYLSGLKGEDLNTVVKGKVEEVRHGEMSGFYRMGGRFIFEPMDTVYIFMSSSYPEYSLGGNDMVIGGHKVLEETEILKHPASPHKPFYYNSIEKQEQEQVFEGLIDTVSYSYDANSGVYNLSIQITNITKYLSMSQINYVPAAGTDFQGPTRTLYQLDKNGEIAGIVDKIVYNTLKYHPKKAKSTTGTKDPAPSIYAESLAGLSPDQCIQMVTTGDIKTDEMPTDNRRFLDELKKRTAAQNSRLGNFKSLRIGNSNIVRSQFITQVPKLMPESKTRGQSLIVMPAHEYLKSLTPYLKMMGQMRVWESNFTESITICDKVAKIILFEFYPDEQGNIYFGPPRINTRPYWKISGDGNGTISLTVMDNTCLRQFDKFEQPSEKYLNKTIEAKIKKRTYMPDLSVKEKAERLKIREKVQARVDAAKNAKNQADENLANKEKEDKSVQKVEIHIRKADYQTTGDPAKDYWVMLNEIAADLKSKYNYGSTGAQLEKELIDFTTKKGTFGDYFTGEIAFRRQAGSKYGKRIWLKENKDIDIDITELINESLNQKQQSEKRKAAKNAASAKRELEEAKRALNKVVTAQEKTKPSATEEEVFTFGSRAWVLDETLLISKTITEDGKRALARVSVQATEPFIGTLGLAEAQQGQVMDPAIWINYGFREEQLRSPFLRTAEAAILYARGYQVYRNANIINGSVTVIGDAKYHIGDTLYIPSNGLLFYISGVQHNYNVGNSFQTTLTLTYGHGLFEDIYHPFAFDSESIFTESQIETASQAESEQQQKAYQKKQEDELLKQKQKQLTTLKKRKNAIKKKTKKEGSQKQLEPHQKDRDKDLAALEKEIQKEKFRLAKERAEYLEQKRKQKQDAPKKIEKAKENENIIKKIEQISGNASNITKKDRTRKQQAQAQQQSSSSQSSVDKKDSTTNIDKKTEINKEVKKVGDTTVETTSYTTADGTNVQRTVTQSGDQSLFENTP